MLHLDLGFLDMRPIFHVRYLCQRITITIILPLTLGNLIKQDKTMHKVMD